jgi:stage III sporulation protein AB
MLREMCYKGVRILGVICILGAAGGIGYFYAQMLRHRLQQLRQLIQLMGLLKGEMEYQCAALPEAMIHSGGQVSGVCGDWFVTTGQRMNRGEGIGFQTLWREQVRMLQTQTVLTDDTVDELFRLGMQMSKPDKRTQLGALELTIQRMKEQEEHLRRELPDKIKVSASLTVLAGVFLIILLI